MQEAFKLIPQSDGGMRLDLNLARTSFSVHITPAELAAIKDKVEAWHAGIHRRSGGTAVSGDPMPYVRRHMMGVLMRRMAEVTPAGLMGAVAKATLQKRVVAKPAPRPAARPAPRPTPVAARPLPKPLPKPVPRPAPVAARPAPKPLPRPLPGKPAPTAAKAAALPKPDVKKLATVTNALKIVSGRHAAHLASTKRKATKPNAAEITAGNAFARAHFTALGIPITNAPHAFWAQPQQAIALKATNAIKAAEGKGAPAPAKPLPKVAATKVAIVTNGLKLMATRRAVLLAFEKRKVKAPNAEEQKLGQAFAQDFFGRQQIPTTATPGPFWTATNIAIKQKVDAALKKAETLGAPAKLPQPFKLERTKLAAVQKGGNLIASRRAKFLAWQRKSKVTTADLKTGQVFAKDFLLKNGIPSTDAPHQFWTQTLPIITTKVNSIVQLAEAQGAPAKPAAPAATPGAPGTKPSAPITPITTTVPPSKTAIIKKGLQELAGRRARFLAWKRKAKTTSPADIAAGKEWARQQFIKKNIPITTPGSKTNIAGSGSVSVIHGWVAPAAVMGAAGAMTRANQLAPKITDARAARSALSLARKQLTDGRAVVSKKFGGTLSRASGQHQSALSAIAQNLSYIEHTEKKIPASGLLKNSKLQGPIALAIIQAGDTLALLDKLEATTFAQALSSGIKSLFGAVGTGIAFVVDAVSAFWSQPEPVIRQRVEDVLRDLQKEAPATVPGHTPAVVPPPPGQLPPDTEEKRQIIKRGFEAGIAKWKTELSKRSMSTTNQNVVNGVAAHFKKAGIVLDAPDPAALAFWSRPKQQIADEVAAAVNGLQPTTAAIPPPAPEVPGDMGPDFNALSEAPGDMPADSIDAPGEMPASAINVPGEIVQPSEPYSPPPGELATADEPNYAPGTMEEPGVPGADPYGNIVPPGQMAEPVTAQDSPYEEYASEVPGQIPSIDEPAYEEQSLADASEEFSHTTLPEEVVDVPAWEAPVPEAPVPEDYATENYASESYPESYAEASEPAYEEHYAPEAEATQEWTPPESIEESAALDMELAEPMAELPDFMTTEDPTQFSTETPTQEEVTGMFELGAAQPRTITKQKYEQLVRKQAVKTAQSLLKKLRGNAKLVQDAKKAPVQVALWAKAKAIVDAILKKKGTAVSGAYLVGTSDIMGAAYVLGEARKGDPKARAQIARTNRAAKAGHPEAKKSMRALALAARMKRKKRPAARPRGLRPLPFAAQNAVYNWPAQRAHRTL